MCIFFLGLGRLSQAEEYLAQAQWTVLKTPECPDSIKSKLFRNLGLLYAAQGNYPDALSQLADDVSLTDSLTSHQISIRMDYHLISLYNIILELNIKIMRIKKMITN